MAQQHCLFVQASLTLFLAFIACCVAFFAPYWLGNATRPLPGSGGGKVIEEPGAPYISYGANSTSYGASEFTWRGLWAQCSGVCQWFWANNYQLQKSKFSKLQWHLATQILYFVAVALVIFSEIFARVQLCCASRMVIYRTIGFILLTSFVVQAAALAVFGGFANRDYGASAFASKYTYLAWAYWMAVAGGCLTLLSGILFLLLDCIDELDVDK